MCHCNFSSVDGIWGLKQLTETTPAVVAGLQAQSPALGATTTAPHKSYPLIRRNPGVGWHAAGLVLALLDVLRSATTSVATLVPAVPGDGCRDNGGIAQCKETYPRRL